MDNEKKTSKKKFRRSILHKTINVFIGLFAFLLFALIIFFGFSQTRTFRDYLKVEISETVTKSINGELRIGNIEGSIISSIILQDTYLIAENDTILKAEEITIKTSPVHLLLKRILVRDLTLKDVELNLLEDKSGVWNISKLSSSSKIDEELSVEPDTTESKFPFGIQVNNIDIQNLNFTRQTYENVNSGRSYKYLTISDLQMKKLSLKGRLFLNLASSTARLYLNNFSVQPNFENFNLNNLSGEFEFTPDYASAKNLMLETDSSNIEIDAKIEELDLLGGVELREFEEYPMILSLQAYPINFSDLYTFIEDIDFLNDKVFLNLEAEGNFGDFQVNNLELSFLESYLNITGKVKELHTPENLYLDVKINDSYILETDAFEIIEGLEIPKYQDLRIEDLNATFVGEPTKFNSTLRGGIDDGSIEVDCYLNLQNEQMEYDISYSSKNIDLFPIIGLQSQITSDGIIKGVGTDPSQMKADLDIAMLDSEIDSIKVDSLYFKSEIDSKFLSIELESIINEAQGLITGTLDLEDENEPIYNVEGRVENLILSNFTKDVRDSSDLNLNFIADGSNLELDDLMGQYEISLSPSYLRDLALDETSMKLAIGKNGLMRDISLTSDFVDFNIEGQFSLKKAIDILIYEGTTISRVINEKVNELNPIYESVSDFESESSNEIPAIAKEELEFEYNFLFKEFELIAEFLDNDELDIVGYGSGSVKNDSLNFKISTDLYIDNLLNKKRNDILYLSEIDATLNFSRDNRSESFNTLFGSVSIEGNKIYAGVELNDLLADLVFNQSKLFFNTAVNIEEDFAVEVEGTALT
ncbi:MAG: AsmA family protein, partial [Melioribacteraceae bacterium]|nr:AsmA family protein [Melioribacteraceae bacterium]